MDFEVENSEKLGEYTITQILRCKKYQDDRDNLDNLVKKLISLDLITPLKDKPKLSNQNDNN